VVEEFLTGPEVSVLAFTDGTAIAPMVSSMDHKRARDGDEGPNTGGMGTIAPNPFYTPEIAGSAGRPFSCPPGRHAGGGVPLRGAASTSGSCSPPTGPKVIEYNCRFGDPETQVVLPLLKSDLLTVMQAVEAGRLADCPVEWREGAAACVVLASGGYPGKYDTGKPIALPPSLPGNVTVYHAGDALRDGRLVTAGGRVLGVTAAAPTLAQAIGQTPTPPQRPSISTARIPANDIGRRALAAQERLSMVKRIYVEKKPGLRQEADALAREVRSLLGIPGPAGAAPTQPLRRGGTGRGRLPPQRGSGVLRAPGGRRVRGAAPGGPHSGGGIPARAVRPAGGLRRPVHPAAHRRSPPRRPHGEGLPALRRSERGGPRARIRRYVLNPVEAREASLEEAVSLAANVPQPDFPPVLEGFTSMDDGALGDLLTRWGLAMDLARPEVLPGLVCRGGPGPHHHGAADHRHLLVRPLPPHHLLHHLDDAEILDGPRCRRPTSGIWRPAQEVYGKERPQPGPRR
jgi:hypothetical protein